MSEYSEATVDKKEIERTLQEWFNTLKPAQNSTGNLTVKFKFDKYVKKALQEGTSDGLNISHGEEKWK